MINVDIKFRQKGNYDLTNLGLIADTGVTKYRTELKIHPFNCFQDLIFSPTDKSLDILYFTSIIYSIDTLIPRSESIDNWSRDIEVEIPVSEVNLWNGSISYLKKALDFLTGDNWNLSFTKVKRKRFKTKSKKKQKEVLPLTHHIDHICLFSGGLDSLVGGIDLVNDNDNILFISHTDNTGASSKIHSPLLQRIQESYPSKNIKQSKFHVHGGANNEATTRGRSLLFHGLAIFHAMNLGVEKIIAPENGVISINLPLTPSRTCSNSTKTMHPYFIDNFQSALSLIGINIKIDNPYLVKTKGEMLIESKNSDLIKELATKTLSCSHGGGHTPGWHRKSLNCGYCIPCTIRRASINKFDIDLDKCIDYGHKLSSSEIDLLFKTKRLDLLALSHFLNRNLNKSEIKREIRLMAKIDNIDDIADMLLRGYAEIKQYIHDKADEDIKGLFSCQLT